MDEKELKEIFRLLEEQGWEPQLCDTPIPYYDSPVMCGKPNAVGDVVKDMQMMPKSFLEMQPVFLVKVQGDSMRDANILDGDSVKVETNVRIHDGDIVLVMIDGEMTVKTYCEDDDGTPWLVPQNPEYKAFQLEPSSSLYLIGKVTKVLRDTPHVKYSACKKYISTARAEQAGTKEISQQQVEQSIREVAPMIKVARQWYAVFRAMVDAGVISKKAYDTFCSTVRREVPEHEHLPVSDEIQRLAIQSFAKPVNKWTADDAPVKGKRFDEYLKIARQMSELLGIL